MGRSAPAKRRAAQARPGGDWSQGWRRWRRRCVSIPVGVGPGRPVRLRTSDSLGSCLRPSRESEIEHSPPCARPTAARGEHSGWPLAADCRRGSVTSTAEPGRCRPRSGRGLPGRPRTPGLVFGNWETAASGRSPCSIRTTPHACSESRIHQRCFSARAQPGRCGRGPRWRWWAPDGPPRPRGSPPLAAPPSCATPASPSSPGSPLASTERPMLPPLRRAARR